MNKLNFVVIVTLVFALGCQNRDASGPSLDSQVERLHEIMGLLLGDDQREAGSKLLGNLQLTTEEGRRQLDDMVTTFEAKLNDMPQWCDEPQIAQDRISKLDFKRDPKISVDTARRIVEYVVANECLDPRILSMKFIDDSTIEIRTGEIRGPLNGGGCYYIARLERGRWMVRMSSMWVS
jgi:hypothetical protein